MEIKTLQERIEKAKVTIEKKGNTIIKKKAQIEKKYKELEKLGIVNPKDRNVEEFREELKNDENKWFKIHDLYYDINTLKEDIKRGNKEIEAKEKTLIKYDLQLKGEIEKESLFIKEVPQQLKALQDELVEKWNEWDLERKQKLINEYKEIGYKEFMKKYKYNDYEFMSISKEKINEDNEKNAKALVIDLYKRVKDITGEVINWGGIRATQGTHFHNVLNGFVEGKEGIAKVESILAGGHNIQKLHIRVLVKEY